MSWEVCHNLHAWETVGYQQLKRQPVDASGGKSGGEWPLFSSGLLPDDDDDKASWRALVSEFLKTLACGL